MNDGVEELIIDPRIGFGRTRELDSRRNQEPITDFLGEGAHSVEAYSTEWYYGSVLAWSVKSIFTCPEWKTVSVLALVINEPAYKDVQTDYTKFESCLVNGQMLLEHGDDRFVVTIRAGAGYGNCVQIQAAVKYEEKVKQLIQDIADFMNKNNFYRGKHICMGQGVSFLEVAERGFDSVFIDPPLKDSIRQNTTFFLKNKDRWAQYGIPVRRGVLLSGEPGTGKTIIIKSLIAEAENITCLLASAYSMFEESYISDLYTMAQDLSPSIVFIEDLDSVAQGRLDMYRGIPPLIALLNVLDGIEEQTAIVTVATTNCLESLDKALSERPNRFDLVVKMTRPDYHMRIEMLKYFIRKMPVSEDLMEYMAKRTEGCSPAQVEAIPRVMAISQVYETGRVTEFSREDVDRALVAINKQNNGMPFGFCSRR